MLLVIEFESVLLAQFGFEPDCAFSTGLRLDTGLSSTGHLAWPMLALTYFTHFYLIWLWWPGTFLHMTWVWPDPFMCMTWVLPDQPLHIIDTFFNVYFVYVFSLQGFTFVTLLSADVLCYSLHICKVHYLWMRIKLEIMIYSNIISQN